MSRWDELDTEAQDYLCWWIEELEAPPTEALFEQGQGVLAIGEFKRCCLGVYCEVHPEVTVDSSLGSEMFIDSKTFDTFEAEMIGELNDRLMQQLHLENEEMTDLVLMNDSKAGYVGVSFVEIAAELRTYYGVPEWV